MPVRESAPTESDPVDTALEDTIRARSTSKGFETPSSSFAGEAAYDRQAFEPPEIPKAMSAGATRNHSRR